MTASVQLAQQRLESLAEEFFEQSVGNWRSERRYYSLKSGEIEEVVSNITVRFIEKGSSELIQLAQMHELSDLTAMICGSQVTWESSYSQPGRKPTTGSTIFGIKENILYRDRGFATPKPVTAEYYLRDSKTMHLRTEYNGSVFEEEIKLIGTNYRTRQTIISRAGEEIMIGQYLETRIFS
ncbi:MAG: phycobiliprotein lyase [Calothrix sp. C42_A2020_038]|nr:phycobiliprotein lyase [Calothrix sp. C42_A2020_038]